MREKARMKEMCMKTENIEQLLEEENWEDVLSQSGEVIGQLQNLAKESGQSKQAEADIANLLEQVYL